MNRVDIEDSNALLDYLSSTNRLTSGERPRFTNLRGGVSNRTVLVERPTGEAWVLKQALPKLRVTEDWFSDPARIHRESLGLEWLGRILPHGAIPKLVFEDHDQHLLAMEAIPQPHQTWKALLLGGHLQPAHVQEFARLLGAIHRQSRDLPADVRSEFLDRTHFETLRLEPYYRFTAARHPLIATFIDELIAETWLTRLSLVHGDYSPKNVLVHQNRLVLLDHEVIHFGDPAFDLGFAATHLLSKANHLKSKRSEFFQAARDFWNVYRETAPDIATAPTFEPRAVRHALACLLARIDGRSPLEYLSESERSLQRMAVFSLIGKAPDQFHVLIERFAKQLEER